MKPAKKLFLVASAFPALVLAANEPAIGGLLGGPKNSGQAAYVEQINLTPPGPVPGLLRWLVPRPQSVVPGSASPRAACGWWFAGRLSPGADLTALFRRGVGSSFRSWLRIRSSTAAVG